MKIFDWNEDKNLELKIKRNISFEEIVIALNNGNLLDVITHPNQIKYKGQKIFFVNINNYVFSVPFIEENNKIFLKTIYPDRKATKLYLGENNE
jgi:hypothetical protein